MAERMSSADAAFLHRETRSTPQHVGGLAVFAVPEGGFDYERLIGLIEERISLAPRYRQKVRSVPGNLASPIWVDDPAFDINYHVRRSALPRPGDDAQLLEFCARIQSRMLDRARPLWEMYLVEGLSGDRVAVVTKTHETLVGQSGGIAGIDLAQVILDAGPVPRRTVEAIWVPGPEPSGAALVRDAVTDLVHRPRTVLDVARAAGRDLGATAERARAVASTVSGLAGISLITGTVEMLLHRQDASPLHAEPGEQRRLAIARARLADYRVVRDAFGGSVNDVALAVVAGALRGWLLARAYPLRSAGSIRALVPVSVSPGDGDSDGGNLDDEGALPTSTNDVRPLLIDLPVGEPDPRLRLARVRYAMATHATSGRAVGAASLAGLSGFAPPTLHALGARASTELARRLFSLVVTNVPGPQLTLYAAGARMTEMFTFLPLSPGQALSVAMSSYDGGVFFGVNADRDAVPDAAVFAELLEDSIAELVTCAETAASSGVTADRSMDVTRR